MRAHGRAANDSHPVNPACGSRALQSVFPGALVRFLALRRAFALLGWSPSAKFARSALVPRIPSGNIIYRERPTGWRRDWILLQENLEIRARQSFETTCAVCQKGVG
jgi:hypothetical protein